MFQWKTKLAVLNTSGFFIASSSSHIQNNIILSGEAIKRPSIALENRLSPEHQSNNVESFLFIFPMFPKRFINLSGFDRPFLHFEMGDFLPKATFENLQKREKAATASKISLCSPS